MTDLITGWRPRRAAPYGWERRTGAVLVVTLLAIAVARVGAAAWLAIQTWLARGEIRVVLPTRYEVPAGPVSSGAAEPGISIVSGGFGTGEFVLSSVDESAHLQLTLARATVAVLLLALVALVAAVGSRIARGRSVGLLLARASGACGLLVLVGSLAASGLEAAALRTIAADLRDVAAVTSVFPDDVRFSVEWTAVCGGLALIVFALVVRAAEHGESPRQELVPTI